MRDWLHVSDHCRAVDLLIEPGTNGEVYNIGGGNHVRNVDLTRRILELAGKPDVADPASRRPPGPRPPLLARHHEAASASAGRRRRRSRRACARPSTGTAERVVVAADQGADPAFRAYYEQQYGSTPL